MARPARARHPAPTGHGLGVEIILPGHMRQAVSRFRLRASAGIFWFRGSHLVNDTPHTASPTDREYPPNKTTVQTEHGAVKNGHGCRNIDPPVKDMGSPSEYIQKTEDMDSITSFFHNCTLLIKKDFNFFDLSGHRRADRYEFSFQVIPPHQTSPGQLSRKNQVIRFLFQPHCQHRYDILSSESARSFDFLHSSETFAASTPYFFVMMRPEYASFV